MPTASPWAGGGAPTGTRLPGAWSAAGKGHSTQPGRGAPPGPHAFSSGAWGSLSGVTTDAHCLPLGWGRGSNGDAPPRSLERRGQGTQHPAGTRSAVGTPRLLIGRVGPLWGGTFGLRPELKPRGAVPASLCCASPRRVRMRVSRQCAPDDPRDLRFARYKSRPRAPHQGPSPSPQAWRRHPRST